MSRPEPGRAPGYQGEVVDRLLPPDRRFRVRDRRRRARALVDAVDAEVTAIGGTPAAAGDATREALKHGIHELRARFAARHFVEVGIGCEACHGGSREHVDDPRVLPDFAPRSAFLEARPEVARTDGEVTRAERINRVCARCHQVLFSRYPFTWEGGQRRGGNPGGSSITSGEARDFLLGGCARQMSCVTCHDPHGEDRRAELDRLATPAGNGVCVRCHAQYAAPAALASARAPRSERRRRQLRRLPHAAQEHGARLRAHPLPPHRPPRRSGARRARSSARVRALPHRQDASGSWSPRWSAGGGAGTIARALTALYGSLDARPLPATLERGKAHEQAAALATLGAAHVTAAAPAVARQLVNPFPLVRYYARRALEGLRGQDCAVDLDRPTPEIAAAVRACVPEAFAAGPPSPTGAAPARGGNDVDED